VDPLRELGLLIESRYPIIAIASVEEQRVEEILQRTAITLETPLYVWTVADGLRRMGSTNPFPDGKNPAKALAAIAEFTSDGIYFFKDLQRFFNDGEVVRRMCDVAQKFVRRRSAIVLLGSHIDLPDELKTLAAPFKLDLPDSDALRNLAKDVMTNLTSTHHIKVDLSPPEFDQLVESLKGLTLFEAERVVTRAVLDDLVLNRQDLEKISGMKKDLLEREALLDYTPTQEALADIGGLGHLKAWLTTRKQVFSPEARRFGLTPPKGILLIGVQGCGKSLAAAL